MKVKTACFVFMMALILSLIISSSIATLIYVMTPNNALCNTDNTFESLLGRTTIMTKVAELQIYLDCGQALYDDNRFEDVILLNQKAFTLLDDSLRILHSWRIYYYILISHTYLGNYEKALAYADSGFRVAKQDVQVAQFSYGKARVFYLMGDDLQAFMYIQLSVRWYKQLHLSVPYVYYCKTLICMRLYPNTLSLALEAINDTIFGYCTALNQSSELDLELGIIIAQMYQLKHQILKSMQEQGQAVGY